ncbi:putative F-box protein At3g10790 [Arabidopsis lyrata subsp. lyrata]|uniref:putative F-box protein At3g10790 n=1 Tax=Arabidopsis lyrata subsp. lyrata TaxID=81972 RepID=UPI000A29E134|nr:putative F-box protein At3g10790 [Arabidopsis lyrata subsp. lyrata]|eukprot:XP_020885974.1 putative F-box protein At3g10790 [Arabidopsis lyrata subsp. lyrata]
MEQLKVKKTIGNTSKRVTRSQTYPFEGIMPLNLKEEILMKLKAKTISKLILLSKSWSSIVLNKDFTNMYLTQSLARPRLLFSIYNLDIDVHFFHSCSQEDPSSDHQRVRCYPDSNSASWYDYSPPVRGLICCLENLYTKVVIGNPTTCQFVTLPRVRTKKKDIFPDIFPFLGYDPVKDEYKVLCMTIAANHKGNVVSKEHQVFTLGGKKKKWRMIDCEINHYLPPRTKGICSNGVVYYLAMVNHVQSLMCFDVGSEKFSVVKLPGKVGILAKYGEKIAVTNLLFDCIRLDVWILEDASKQEWSNIYVLVPSCVNRSFSFRGILGTGELLFAPEPTSFYLLCYDLKEHKARKIWIKGLGDYTNIEVFLDHVENPMVLSKIR